MTIDGERTEFSTQHEIDPTKWNSKAGHAIITTKEETRQLNSFLETLRAQIYEAQRELLNKGKEITIKSITDKMLGIEEEVVDPLKDPFMNYKVKIRDTNRPLLLQDELDKIIALKFTAERLANATTVTLTNGVPIETVSKMLGHKTLRTTQQYTKVLDQKVSEI